MMPEKDRKKVMSMRTSASAEEVHEEKSNLKSWLESIPDEASPRKSKGVSANAPPSPPPGTSGDIFSDQQHPPKPPAFTAGNAASKANYPPVRGSKEANLQTARKARGEATGGGMPDGATSERNEKPRLNKESMSNRDYFRAWDKFDVNDELDALDAEDEVERMRAQEAR